MGFDWRILKIPRFYGLDLKTNVVDVADGFSLDCDNVFQNQTGVTSKRRGNEPMFDADAIGGGVDEIGAATLGTTKYYFRFSGGGFYYSTSRTGSLTALSPSPAISTTNPVYWANINDKLFFVDGTNDLRFFDGSAIYAATVYSRPTVAPTTSSGGTGYDYSYTVERVAGTTATGESAVHLLQVGSGTINIGNSATIRVPMNTGPQTLAAGDRIRIYRRATATVASYKNFTNNVNNYYTVTAGDVAATFADIPTVSTTDPVVIDQRPNLYTDLGIAINKSAPTALVGIDVHYGRLVGWKDDYLYTSKVTNPFSFPDDAAPRQAFVYGVGVGDGESITRAISFREALIVFKTSSFYALPGIGPDDTGGNAFSYRRVESNGIGAVAGKSCVVLGDEGDSYLVFLSRQGFMATTGDRPERVGESIESQTQSVSASNLASAVAIHHKRDGLYLCSLGADAAKTIWVLDVRKDNDKLTGWFKWTDINPKCMFYDDDRYLFGTPQGFACSERISGTASDYSDIGREDVSFMAVNDVTDTITVTVSYNTADPIIFRNATVPVPLVANTTYYAIRVSATAIKVATSAANALAGTAIDITAPGAGTFAILRSAPIDAFYTTNWIKFETPTHVKKLGRPALLLNAAASTVSLSVSVAYDWVGNFNESLTVSVGSTDTWGTLAWGVFSWGEGAVASNRNMGIARRKVRSIRFKVRNNTLNQDFNCQGLEIPFDVIRNRGNYS